MGLNRRKKSGKYIGGSRLIVDGQPIYAVKKYIPEFKKQRVDDFDDVIPVTTTTTTIPVETCYILTQDDYVITTQNDDRLIWC